MLLLHCCALLQTLRSAGELTRGDLFAATACAGSGNTQIPWMNKVSQNVGPIGTFQLNSTIPHFLFKIGLFI
jgi:hypothetical protein